MSHRAIVLAAHAHRLRQAPTDSEARLWRTLRSSQLGCEFRRQVVLLGFIVDFFAPGARLVIEVDGGYHARRRKADESRDRKLRRAGYRVLRVDAELVHRDLYAVVARITGELQAERL
jgi:very-short-patch-repair endonuclease